MALWHGAPTPQPGHAPPPQSTARSLPFRAPSVQELDRQTRDGAAQESPGVQSPSLSQPTPSPQRRAQRPPQSTPVSLGPRAPSSQLGSEQTPASLHPVVLGSSTGAQLAGSFGAHASAVAPGPAPRGVGASTAAPASSARACAISTSGLKSSAVSVQARAGQSAPSRNVARMDGTFMMQPPSSVNVNPSE